MEFPITNPVLFIAVLVAIALFVPMIFDRLRLPGMVGLILIAVVLGPFGIGMLDRNVLIEFLGQAGLLFIVFVAGLEIDLGRFVKYRHHSIVFGSISFLIPQILGTLVGVYFLGFSWPSAILLGSMFGSHTLLAYPVASRLGITKLTSVTTSVGGTIITDTAALMVLAVIANSTGGTNEAAFWIRFALLFVLFLVLVFKVLPPLTSWFYRTVPDEGARDFMFTILMLFLFAFLAEFAGLQPIIGAFFCGIALNRLIPERSPLMNRVQFVGRTLLVPIFLISVGMLVDPRALISDPYTIRIIAAMSVTVVVTKWLAAFISGKALRYSWTDCWVLFGMSVNQAAATLAAVIVGYEIGLFDTAVVNGAIVMILITSLIGPSATAHWGIRLAESGKSRRAHLGESPQRILITIANPATVEPLMDLALLIRDPNSREPIFPLAIVSERADVDSKLVEAEKLLARASIRGTSADAPVYPVTRIDVNIAEGIRRTLVEQQITTVVIGWNGRVSLARRIFGNVVDQLLAQSRQSIVVARLTRPLNTVNRVILAVPRAAEHEVSFADSVHLIKVLCNQLATPLLVLSPSEDSETLQTITRKTRPSVKIEFKTISRLRDLPEVLDETLESDDLVVLMSARHHRLSWTPSLETLPRKIAESHPKQAFLVVYPAEDIDRRPTDDPEPIAIGSLDDAYDEDEHRLIARERIALNVEDIGMREVLCDLLNADFGDDPTLRDRLAAGLFHSAYEYPVEIRKGIFILHVHDAAVLEPQIYFATSANGIRLPNSSDRARIMIALISPESATPAQHLRALNRVARQLHSSERVDKLLAAKKISQAWQELKGLNETES
ncbi:MAG: cation:proton antiporter [Opitutales bacterium]|nr:cation:proton antiporter [Opitutales bacterium]